MAIGTGAALALGGATIAGGLIGADASRDAARAQAGASRNALNLQREIFETQRADLEPWRQFGSDALSQLSQIYGLGGQAPTQDFSFLTNSPDYQFALQQGTQALDRSAASRGRLYSGAQMQGAQRFGQGLATQTLGNYLNRLGSFAGVGQQAVNALGQAGQSYAGNATNALLNQGNAQASSYINRGNTFGNVLGDLSLLYGASSQQPLVSGGYGNAGGGF